MTPVERTTHDTCLDLSWKPTKFWFCQIPCLYKCLLTSKFADRSAALYVQVGLPCHRSFSDRRQASTTYRISLWTQNVVSKKFVFVSFLGDVVLNDLVRGSHYEFCTHLSLSTVVPLILLWRWLAQRRLLSSVQEENSKTKQTPLTRPCVSVQGLQLVFADKVFEQRLLLIVHNWILCMGCWSNKETKFNIYLLPLACWGLN